MGSGEAENLGQTRYQDNSTPEQISPAAQAASFDLPKMRHAEQDEVDPALRGTLYQVVASRRLGYDGLVWQVPALGLTAQAFLFTTALNSSTSKFARLVSAALALIIALISMQLMSKHRYHEEIDSKLLEVLEMKLQLGKLYGCAPHAPPPVRAEAIEKLSADYPIKPVKSSWVKRQSSYRLWMYGLAMFALAAMGIIVTTAVDLTPWLRDVGSMLIRLYI